jgi:hypothetical protein
MTCSGITIVREFATLIWLFKNQIKGKQDFTLYPIAKERIKNHQA